MGNKIAIIGGGAFATSISQQLSYNKLNDITLFVRDVNIANEINDSHTNRKYFPNRILSKELKADSDLQNLKKFSVIILAIPSRAIREVGLIIKEIVSSETLIINMAKGIDKNGKTFVDYFKTKLGFSNVISLKGPSFSNELINNEPTLLTLGFSDYKQLEIVKSMVKNTNLYIDYTQDIRGVEYLSALKNIYAIYIGNIDAKFNSANTKFFILTKCINEIKVLLKYLKCNDNTFLLSCGIGDFCLTSLNDMSRNRTLGLLLGKGFYEKNTFNNTVVLEGVRTLHFLKNIVDEELLSRLPILNELISFLVDRKSSTLSVKFDELLRRNYTTVLTYGTFDLLHYGHLELLYRAKDYGNKLIVGLSSDEFNLEKGKKCEFNFEKRKQYLNSLDVVDHIIPETNWDQKIQDIKNYKVDYFIMGDDWKGKFDYLKEYCKVIYLPRTKGVSTTDLKKILYQD